MEKDYNINLTKSEVNAILDIMDEIDEFSEIQRDIWILLYNLPGIEEKR